MGRAYEVTGAERTGDWVVSCDHATNIVPGSVNGGDLGLPPCDMARHIAYDVGAEGVALALGEALGAPVVASRFSRLVIDPNRGEDDPTLLMRIYDGSIIPANRHADAAEVARRLDAFHRPYHGALAELMAARAAPVLVSVHSFTPQLAGRAMRPWQIGVLSAADRRLSEGLIAALNAPDFAAWVEDISGAPLRIGDNQPYSGHLPGDAVDRHALAQGHLNTLIEIRNDLIATPAQQAAWGARLAPLLRRALHDAGEDRQPMS
ncbi:N-formylglutamate amidohydrolase [Poseidonocella sp. HB161398]|uniref:N-formylglutamate amidohydrolase n=1 Tax=Poseidonocella sp. HB161398 TaxID=2320855 RepID=UPI001108E06C|nr:N-formylglutamate amidohydrolase [Poseidonocella sp. HB161398]